jgi:hypothetical protein
VDDMIRCGGAHICVDSFAAAEQIRLCERGPVISLSLSANSVFGLGGGGVNAGNAAQPGPWRGRFM